MLEFGARSTGEPSESRVIRCDAAEFLDAVTFPTATPEVMRPERTFWEKATAIHVFCAQGAFRGWQNWLPTINRWFARQAERKPEVAHFVLEQVSQRFQKFQVQGLGQTTHVVVRFDSCRLAGFCADRFDHIRSA
jgi:Nucleotidyl transferase AbiEii toxin, Type IV TA system